MCAQHATGDQGDIGYGLEEDWGPQRAHGRRKGVTGSLGNSERDEQDVLQELARCKGRVHRDRGECPALGRAQPSTYRVRATCLLTMDDLRQHPLPCLCKICSWGMQMQGHKTPSSSIN